MKNKKKTLMFKLLLSTALIGSVIAIPLVSVSCSSSNGNDNKNTTYQKPTITNIDVHNISEARFAILANADPFDQKALNSYMNITGNIKRMHYDTNTNEITGTYRIDSKSQDIKSIGVIHIDQTDFFSSSKPTISNIDIHNITLQKFEQLFIKDNITLTITNLSNYMNITSNNSIDSIMYDNTTNQIKGNYLEASNQKIYEFESEKLPAFGVKYTPPSVQNTGLNKITEANFETLVNKAKDKASWLENKNEIESYVTINHDGEVQSLFYTSAKQQFHVTYLVNSWSNTTAVAKFSSAAINWKS